MKYQFFIVLAVSIFCANCGSNASTSNAPANLNSNVILVTNSQPSPEKSVEKSAEVPVYDNAQTAVAEGKKFFDANEDEKAAKAFEQAIKLDPNQPEAHFLLAIAYENLDRKEDADKSFNNAIKAYEKFLKKNPKDAAAHFNLGRAYGKIFEDEKAEKSLREAVKLNEEDTEYYYELGATLVKLAKYAEAVKALKKSLELDPENSRAEVLLEKAESGEKRVKDAQEKNEKNKNEQTKPVTGKKPNKNANAPVSDDDEAPRPPPKSNANQQ